MLQTFSNRFALNREQALPLAGIATFAVFGFALLNISYPKPSFLFEGVFLLLFFAALPRAPQARRDKAWWFLWGSIAVAVLTYCTSHLEFPRYAEPYPQIDVLGNLFLFFPIAFWLGGSTRNVMILLSVSLAGFFLAIFHFGAWSDLSTAVNGQRVSFGLRNAQHTAVFFGTALIGWIAFFNRLTHADGRLKPWRLVLWILFTILLLVGVVITQTRAVWLGLLPALVVMGVFWIFRSRHLNVARAATVAGIVTVALIAAFIFSGAGTIVSKRIGAEQAVVDQILAGDAADVPYSSIGIRIKLWQEGFRWIEQRPITGWGYRAKKSMIDDSPRFPDWFKKSFGHMHNSVLAVWVTFGLLGVALVSWLAIRIGSSAWRHWRRGAMPTDLFLFGIGFFPFWIAVNQFESYVIWGTGTYLMAIVCGALYTYQLRAEE